MPSQTVLRIQKPRKSFKDLEGDSQRKKANLVKEVIFRIVGNDENGEADKSSVYELLKKLVKSMGNFHLLADDEFKYNNAQLAAYRYYCGQSTNALLKMDRFDRSIMGNTRFPSQLGKQMKIIEERDIVPCVEERVELSMNASSERGLCSFTYIGDPIRLVEKMFEALLHTPDYQDSFAISNMKEKRVVVFGSDKDTHQTSMLLRTANRKRGNNKLHVRTLAYYEDAEEKYENLQNTFLNKENPVRKLCQLLLDNKLFAFTFTLYDEKEQPVKTLCKLVHLFKFHEDQCIPLVDVSIEEKVLAVFFDDCDELPAYYSSFEAIGLELPSGGKKKFHVRMAQNFDVSFDLYIGF